MNKAESKYYNTAIKMDEALLTLLHTKEFNYITIKDICMIAGVNRSTFYLHYETTSDLLDETVEMINTRFNSYFKDIKLDVSKINSMPLNELYLISPKYLIPWLEFIYDNKKIFLTFIKRHKTLGASNSYEQIFNNIFGPILTRFGVEKINQKYMMLYYIDGVGGIIKEWVRNDCNRDINDIANIIMGCIIRYEDRFNK